MPARLVIAAILILLTPLAAAAAEPAEYAMSTLDTGAVVIGHKSADINGDGLIDIVAACLGGDKKPERSFRVFYQQKGGGFPKTPDATLPIPAGATVYDTGDIGGKGAESVCFLTPDGLYAFVNGGKTLATSPRKIIDTQSVFSAADPYDMPCWPLFAPGGKGADVALIPGVYNIRVYVMENNGYAYKWSLGTPVETSFEGGPRVGADGTMTVSQRLAEPHFGFYSDKDTGALILTWDDNADVYNRNEGSGFAVNAVQRFRPELMKPPKKGPLENAWVAPLDFDGDGRIDFAVTKKTGGVAHARSLIFVYIRDKKGNVPEKPTHTIITEGVVGPRFVDMNADGRLDILLPSVKVGVRNFVNILTSGEVGVDIAIYLQKKDGTYPDAPDREKRVTFELDLDNIGKAVPVLETGRFSADGGYGLAVVSGTEVVQLYTHDRYSYLSSRPGLELEVPGPSELEVTDLNSDGVDDLVMTYRKSGRLPGTVNVLVSK